MQARRASSFVLALLFGAVLPLAAAVEIDSNTFGALRARSIGPAVMSGRIAAIDANSTRGWLEKTGDQMAQRALSGTIASGYGNPFSVSDGEINRIQNRITV